MIKKFTAALLLFAIFGIQATFSQTSREEFDRFRQQSERDFRAFQEQSRQDLDDFRARTNAEFAAFMNRPWRDFQVVEPTPPPPPPPPIEIPKIDPEQEVTTEPIPIKEIIVPPPPEPRPQPIAPIEVPEPPTPEVPVPDVDDFSFLFFNTQATVRLNDSLRFTLYDITEQTVAQMWYTLSSEQYNALIADCLALRDRLNLSDWGYKSLLRTMSEQFFGEESNEAVLLQMFILTQSGYKVRIARAGEQLALLVPFRENLYGYAFLYINRQRFYIMNRNLRTLTLHVFDEAFPREQFFSWQTSLPNLAVDLTAPRTFSTAPCLFFPNRPEIYVTIQTNRNLVDFLYTYPFARWDMYVHAGLSDIVRQSLFPVLQRAVAGKSNLEAVQVFLDFLHHAFDYMTDCEQFGYEKPFFADESFFFPYNDCKDRSILFSILVRDLLGLEVVLLHYPNHLSTAVHFPEYVQGNYFMIDGRRFVEADPTFINARVGMTMPQFRGVSANIVRL